MNDNSKFKNNLILAGVVLTLGIGATLAYPNNKAQTNTAMDVFAKCVAAAGAVMYGADWCPHCQNEKNAFGESFKFINYVECPDNPNLCLQKGIKGYPTWIFGDGSALVGEQGLERLSQATACPLNQ